LPGKGCSTPAVWDRRIYLTAPTNGLDAALAFDWAGKPLWHTTLGPEQAGKHRKGSGSNASPATDGHAVFVYFKSGTLAALELDGQLRWQTNLVERFGPDTLYWDHGTSPVLTKSCVVMTRMHHGESWVVAFDKASGAGCGGRLRAITTRRPKAIMRTRRPSSFSIKARRRCWFGAPST